MIMYKRFKPAVVNCSSPRPGLCVIRILMNAGTSRNYPKPTLAALKAPLTTTS